MRKYEVEINSKQYSVVVKNYTGQNAEMEINGKPYFVKLDTPIVSSSPVYSQPQAYPMQSAQPVQPAPVTQTQPVTRPANNTPTPTSAGAEVIKAPIPGSILEVLVNVGDTVADGQTVFKMEAMKMENDINTTTPGVVKAINVKVGDAVNQGQDLMVIE
ncbi:acetyl-CoA carboxylase biotin carboxyl carrier protein subunit [bacterium]|nr:acetyl-CoA carboxylase biotin carboxyl carrier protein subunit [bacterium]